MSYQIRGGNAAIYRNGEYRTDTNAGCPRMIKLRSHGFQVGIEDPATIKVFKVGHLFEEWFDKENPGLIKEHCVQFQINPSVEFVGHIDFMNDDYLYELKSVTSKNTYREVFKKGKPKEQNLLQLITYMVALERDKGKLIYGSFTKKITYEQFEEIGDDEFEELCETLVPDDTIEFHIHMCENGHFYCNNVELDIHINDITEFWQEASLMILDEDVPSKPVKLSEKNFFGPCHFCPAKNICASDYDSWDQFYNTVKNFIASK